MAATSEIGASSAGSYTEYIEDINDTIERTGVPHVIKIDIEGAEAQIIDRVKNNLGVFENVKFFIEVHFSIIESDHDSELFFSNLSFIKRNSKAFHWIDSSHLYFQLQL